MTRTQRHGASQSHSSCCELIGHRCPTDEVVRAQRAQRPPSSAGSESLRCKFKFIRGVSKVGIPNFVSGPREYIMEGEYVIREYVIREYVIREWRENMLYLVLAMCSWFRISWFRIICWHCWRASGNKWIKFVDLLRPLKNHGLIVFILTYTPWLLCHGFAF